MSQRKAKTKIDQNDSAAKCNQMKDAFKDLALKLGRVPSGDEFYDETGYSRAEVRTLFVKYQDLQDEACEYHRFALKNIFTPKDFGPHKHKELLSVLKKYSSVIVTTAQPKAPLNVKFFRTLEHLAEKNNSLILILKTQGDLLHLDGRLKKQFIVTQDLRINSNLTIWPIEASATAASIAKGFKKYTSVESSLLLPSTKQEMHVAPNMGKLPRAVFTPGAVTLPIYGNKVSDRKAREDHYHGAYLIDIKDDISFFAYNIDAYPDGSVVHKSVLYRPDGSTRRLSEDEVVRVCGDDHAMIHSPRVARVLAEVQELMPAFMKVSHDTWDQHIANHHSAHDKIYRAQMAEKFHDRIEVERKITQAFIEKAAKEYKQVLCVSSNHNEALARFNSEGRYMDEDQNWKIGHMTALAQFYGIDPVEFAVNHYDEFQRIADFFKAIKEGKKKSITLSTQPLITNVRFLKRGEDFKWGGFSLGFHGDEGSGGAKGTVDAMAFIHSGNTASYDAGVIVGHTHSSFKRNRTINVGTSTALPHEEDSPGYAKGSPNAWLNSFADVYQPVEYKGKVGTAQLFLIIDEDWEVKKRAPAKKKAAKKAA